MNANELGLLYQGQPQSFFARGAPSRTVTACRDLAPVLNCLLLVRVGDEEGVSEAFVN